MVAHIFILLIYVRDSRRYFGVFLKRASAEMKQTEALPRSFMLNFTI